MIIDPTISTHNIHRLFFYKEWAPPSNILLYSETDLSWPTRKEVNDWYGEEQTTQMIQYIEFYIQIFDFLCKSNNFQNRFIIVMIVCDIHTAQKCLANRIYIPAVFPAIRDWPVHGLASDESMIFVMEQTFMPGCPSWRQPLSVVDEFWPSTTEVQYVIVCVRCGKDSHL